MGSPEDKRHDSSQAAAYAGKPSELRKVDAERLAGLALAAADPTSAPLAAKLVLPAARAVDLEILAAGFSAPELQPLFAELIVARATLPADVADALVATALPGHARLAEALFLLTTHIELLERIEAPPSGVVRHIAGKMRRLVSERQRDQDAARAEVSRMTAQLRQAAGRIATTGRRIAVEDVERAAALIAVPQLSIGFLEVALENTDSVPVVERLLLALALRRAVHGTDHEHLWKALLAKLASDSIYELRELQLFALRLRLLDEVIEAAHPTISKSQLYFQRANTRLVLSAGDQRLIELSRADMMTAVREARAEADAAHFAAGTAAWAKLLAQEAAEGGVASSQELAVAESTLADVLELPLEPIDKAAVHQARAHLLRLRSPQESVSAIEDALALLAPGERFWTEVAAELVATLLRADRGEEAVARGMQYVNRAGNGIGTERGMLHFALGEALLAAERWDEARLRLEDALQLLRGRDPLNEALARLKLAQLGFETGDSELTEQQLGFLRDHAGELDRLTRRDVDLLEAAMAAARGEAGRQRTLLVRALSNEKDERASVGMRLELARLELGAGRPVDDVDALVLLSLRTPLDRRHDDVLTGLLCEHSQVLARSTLEQALGWARHRGPSLVAWLLHQLGRTGEARTFLRSSLAGDLAGRERLACTHRLMILLQAEDDTERRTLCVEIERLLDVVEDVPHVRLDLAAGLAMSAGDELALILRARAHARRALEAPLDPGERESAHRTIALTTNRLIWLSLPLSSPSIAQEASHLLEELALHEFEASKLRMVAAHLLLVPGPVAHPDAVNVAGRLLGLVPTPPNTGAFESLVERFRWVRDRVAATAEVAPALPDLAGPLDDVPAWLIDKMHGRGGTVAPDDVAQAAEALSTVARARPDAIDTVLATAVSVQHNLSEGPRQKVLEAVYAAVQVAIEAGNNGWPGLRETLDGVRSDHHHPMLANISSVTSRATSAAPREESAQHGKAGEPEDSGGVQVGGGRQRARDCWERGVALMDRLRRDSHTPDAGRLVSEARSRLGEAVAIARDTGLPELFDFLVSHGNSWRLSPDNNTELAIQEYESAAALPASPDQKAKLWKVWADTLRLKGGKDDLRLAEQLLERACRIRRGRNLAETLWSRALVALIHPDLDEAARERGATQCAMDAVRAHRAFGEQDAIVNFLIRRLSAWARAEPDDPTPARLRGELKAMYPGRAAQFDAPLPDARDVASVIAFASHPAGKAFMSVRARLTADLGRSPSRFDCDPDRAEKLLESLAVYQGAADRPGVRAARVVVLALLVRLGRRTVTEVQNATVEATASIGDIEGPLVQAMLLRNVATAWAPDDHMDDPVRDFALAADLLRRSLELEGGVENAVGDTLAALARALRYSPAGDLQSNLRESRQLFVVRLERARMGDEPDVIANILHNLADVESQLGTGSRPERLRTVVERLEEAAVMAKSPQLRAQCLARLAWERTQLGMVIGGAEGLEALEKALATFDAVDCTVLDERRRAVVEANRLVCQGALTAIAGGRAAEVTSWRAQLATLGDNSPAYSVATAKHNLANALMFGSDVTREELAEGLQLSREAAAVRTLEVDARHHWETSLNIGTALLGALASGRRDLLPLSSIESAAEAVTWLRRAVTAARALGRGEELLDAAFALTAIANETATLDELVEMTEEAWTNVREASAYLLLNLRSRERETRVATTTVLGLAYRLAQRSIEVRSRGIAFVLQAESAQRVERWIVRAQQPARRALQARLSRPPAVSVVVWDEWKDAVNSRDPRRMADSLDRVREAAPAFLAEEHANDVTWRWLEARPGSVAVALVLAQPVPLALLLRVGSDGKRRTWVLGLELEPPPVPLGTLAGSTGGAGPDAGVHAVLDQLAQWVRRGVVEPIVRFLGDVPSAVLWSPCPNLRLVAPNAIWRDVPVAVATSLVLADLRAAPNRRSSSLLVLADPGPGSAESRLDLCGHGISTLKALEGAATERGPVRLLASVGQRFGRALLGERSVVRDTAASARDVLLEAAEHEIVVLIAHGEFETPEEAAVLCLDASGTIDRLAVAQLARNPDAFAGATVLLLACDGGRMGDSLSEPGGLAGTLLAAGAACVVAPLLPVRLDVAEQVGRSVLNGLAAGDEPWAALARLRLDSSGHSPALGRPAPSLSDRRAEQETQRRSFVAWVG